MPVRHGPRIAFALVAVVLALVLAVGGLIAGGFGRDRSDFNAVPPKLGLAPAVSPRSSGPVAEASLGTTPAPSSSANPSSSPTAPPITLALPDSTDGLAALLPDTLCGVPATKRAYSSPEEFWGVGSVSPGTSLADTALSLSIYLDRTMTVIASTGGSGPCPTFGIFRVVGADPAALRSAYDRWSGGTGSPSNLRWANLAVSVSNGLYATFVGDAIFFVEANTDASAGEVMAQVPGADPGVATDAKNTYRTGFAPPFTIDLGSQWSVTADTPGSVALSGDSGHVEIIRPYGFRTTADLARSLTTLRDPAGELVSHWCPGMADPKPIRLGRLNGIGFSCDAQEQQPLRPFFPTTAAGAAAGVPPDAPADSWFVLGPQQPGRFFLTTVHGEPVVIVTYSDPWSGWAAKLPHTPPFISPPDHPDVLTTISFDP